jgi:hypothetical protein
LATARDLEEIRIAISSGVSCETGRKAHGSFAITNKKILKEKKNVKKNEYVVFYDGDGIAYYGFHRFWGHQ